MLFPQFFFCFRLIKIYKSENCDRTSAKFRPPRLAFNWRFWFGWKNQGHLVAKPLKCILVCGLLVKILQFVHGTLGEPLIFKPSAIPL